MRHLWLLEQSASGLNAFLTSRNLPPMPHANRTQRAQHDLTPAQKARVEKLYAGDYRLYAALRRSGGYSDRLIGSPINALRRADTSASTAS